jgi:hypothetical protein
MKVMVPVTVTDAILTSCNIPETDYSAWSAATTYARGDFCISTATHTVYRSLTAGNINHDPDLEQVALADPLIDDPSPVNWQVISATNRWKLFDKKPSVQAAYASTITATLTPGVFIDAVAGFGIDAATVRVQMVDGATTVYDQTISLQDDSIVIDWLSYFFEPILRRDEFLIQSLPLYANATTTITLTNTGATVKAGQLIIGSTSELGETGIGNTDFSGVDFSYVNQDEFGDLTTVVRAATRANNFEVFVENSRLLYLDIIMRGLRGGVPAVWIGDDDSLKAAINYGFWTAYRNLYKSADFSLINLQIQGIV